MGNWRVLRLVTLDLYAEVRLLHPQPANPAIRADVPLYPLLRVDILPHLPKLPPISQIQPDSPPLFGEIGRVPRGSGYG